MPLRWDIHTCAYVYLSALHKRPGPCPPATPPTTSNGTKTKLKPIFGSKSRCFLCVLSRWRFCKWRPLCAQSGARLLDDWATDWPRWNHDLSLSLSLFRLSGHACVLFIYLYYFACVLNGIWWVFFALHWLPSSAQLVTGSCSHLLSCSIAMHYHSRYSWS